jgi:type II secretory pathway predicted ATPase ExeA
MLSDLMTAYTGPVETVLWKVGASSRVSLLCSVLGTGAAPCRKVLQAMHDQQQTCQRLMHLTTAVATHNSTAAHKHMLDSCLTSVPFPPASCMQIALDIVFPICCVWGLFR